jgi:hypothetical protein
MEDAFYAPSKEGKSSDGHARREEDGENGGRKA